MECSYCEKPAHARGMCPMHYQRWRLHGDPHEVKSRWVAMSPEDRFWSHVDRSSVNGCWEWTAARDVNGYGMCDREHSGSGLAHRTSWFWTTGPIPRGLFLCHRCDNPPCVRPDHLFLGTQADNVADCVSKGRHAAPPTSAGRPNPKRMLTFAQAEAIRLAHTKGEAQRAIAVRFGVSRGTVEAILLRKTYAA